MTRTRINPSIFIILPLLVVTAALRLINISGSPTRLDDEGTYVAQAFAVDKWGQLAHYTYWYDHPPAGWLQLAVWRMLAGPDLGGSAVLDGRYLMVLVSVVTAALLWVLARRIGLSRFASGAAVLIIAVSPLAISLGRSVYLDNLAVAWLIGGLVMICSPQRRLSAMFGAAMCFGISVLTKETVMLFLPMVAWLVWVKTAPATRRYALAVFAAVSGLVVSVYLLMAALRGELLPGPGHVSLWEGVKFQLWQRESGGTLGDPGSLKRHTIDEWLRLDPALPLLAVPIALGGLTIERIRPYAVGLLLAIVTVIRPGYLPVPFVIAMLPFTALVGAALGERLIGWVRQQRHTIPTATAFARQARTAVIFGTAALFSAIVTLWAPGFRTVLMTDEDTGLRQAQQWVNDNVPINDRLIVDDALWVDLVQDGRDRRNVIWSYKVDTDEQVKNWAPDGWPDYQWVVATPSMRANLPEKGVLNEAIAHAKPVATFGSGGTKVDVLRIDSGSATSKPGGGAEPMFGVQTAASLAASSSPDALATLQSGLVDQRIVATLAVLEATGPVSLDAISAVADEEAAGTPRRQFVLSGSADRIRAIAGFLERQSSPFAVESVEVATGRLTIRFPARTADIGLGEPPADVPAGAATVRIADLRRDAPADRLELVRIDGVPIGSLPTGNDSRPSDYRTLAAGTYVATTVGDDGTPILRQAFTVEPDRSYTLALFSAGAEGEVAAQLAPDGPAGSPNQGPDVRLMQAADAVGAVRLVLVQGDGTNVLANDASYGLITGYGAQPAGRYDAVVSTGSESWSTPIELPDSGATTLLLTDGQDGPTLRPIEDESGAAGQLGPPGVALPPRAVANSLAPSRPDHPSQPERAEIRYGLYIIVTLVAAAVLFAKIRGRRHQ
jgi:hypothetical protein